MSIKKLKKINFKIRILTLIVILIVASSLSYCADRSGAHLNQVDNNSDIVDSHDDVVDSSDEPEIVPWTPEPEPPPPECIFALH